MSSVTNNFISNINSQQGIVYEQKYLYKSSKPIPVLHTSNYYHSSSIYQLSCPSCQLLRSQLRSGIQLDNRCVLFKHLELDVKIVSLFVTHLFPAHKELHSAENYIQVKYMGTKNCNQNHAALMKYVLNMLTYCLYLIMSWPTFNIKPSPYC